MKVPRMKALLAALVVAGAVAVASSVEARTLDCQCITMTEPFFQHWFHETGDRPYLCDTPGCHGDERPNGCSSEHEGCGSWDPDGPDGPLATLEDADITEAAAIEFSSRDGVFYNAERGALQMYGCNGTIVASVAIPQQYAAAVIRTTMLKLA